MTNPSLAFQVAAVELVVVEVVAETDFPMIVAFVEEAFDFRLVRPIQLVIVAFLAPFQPRSLACPILLQSVSAN